MKPTRELIDAEMAEYSDGAYADHGSAKDQLTRFYELAYQAGAEKGKADYEREHLRHTVPLPDALKVMQDQVAEACAKLVFNMAQLKAYDNQWVALHDAQWLIRQGEWRKYAEIPKEVI
jgi:flagellar motor switch protein FliG